MTLTEQLLSETKIGRKELCRQDLIVEVTEQIWTALEAGGKTKADLARTLETSKSNITQMLSGQRNLTLTSLADIAAALNLTPHFVLADKRTRTCVYQNKYKVTVEAHTPQNVTVIYSGTAKDIIANKPNELNNVSPMSSNVINFPSFAQVM